MKFTFKNWKTTLSGVVAIIVQVGPVLFPKYINETTANSISVIAGAIGITLAKDHNVTGGTVGNAPNDASVVKEATKKNVN